MMSNSMLDYNLTGLVMQSYECGYAPLSALGISYQKENIQADYVLKTHLY